MARVVGIFSILLGVLWIFRPQNLRGWFIRYTGWTVLWPLFLFLAVLFFKTRQTLGFIGSFAAILITAIALGRAQRLVKTGFEKLPLVSFQAIGLLHILLGLSLLF